MVDGLSVEEQYGGYWGEHPDYPVSDWQSAVADEDTRRGYWEWVENKIAAEDADDDDDE